MMGVGSGIQIFVGEYRKNEGGRGVLNFCDRVSGTLCLGPHLPMLRKRGDGVAAGGVCFFVCPIPPASEASSRR
jgi:hypothetical protein